MCVDVEIPDPKAALASLDEVIVRAARQMHGNGRGRSAIVFDTFEDAE